MKKLAAAGVIAFVVTLGVIVGTRMSTEAMAVVIGVVCGVAAGIPTSLLVVAVTGGRGRGHIRSSGGSTRRWWSSSPARRGRLPLTCPTLLQCPLWPHPASSRSWERKLPRSLRTGRECTSPAPHLQGSSIGRSTEVYFHSAVGPPVPGG
jgi:hypothetical protein